MVSQLHSVLSRPTEPRKSLLFTIAPWPRSPFAVVFKHKTVYVRNGGGPLTANACFT